MKRKIVIAVTAIASMLHISFAADPIPITVNVDGNAVINTLSDHFFGHNYWMWTPSAGNSMPGTDSLINKLNVKLLRFGGIANDLGYPDPVNLSALTEFGNYCKAIHAEPMLQLQIAKYKNTADRAANAALMMDTFKTISDVKYVSIGNEPDIYPENLATNASYNAAHLSTYSLTDYCADFNAVASEVKKKSPDVKLIGPELSWKIADWIPGFLDSCKKNVDMISVHYYPFTADQCDYGSARKQVAYIQSFYKNVRDLIDMNAGGKVIPLIIGETNITWDGEPAHSTESASPGTFDAALWFADFIGVSSVQKNLFSIMPWSIREGWTLGFLDDAKKPKPVYHVYKMFSDNCKKYMIHNQSYNSYVRIYAYKDDLNSVSLFALNWDTLSSYNATIKFSNILSDSTFTYEIPAHSLSCLTFSSDLKDKNIVVYTKNMKEPGVPVITDIKHSSAKSLVGKETVRANFDQKKSVLTIFSDRAISNLSISIFDLHGKVIQQLNPGSIKCGITQIPVSPSKSSSGMRIIKLSIGDKILKSIEL